MQSGVQITCLNVDDVRTRLRKMSDEKLCEFGKAARYMTTSRANLGKPPHPDYVLQLEEAKAEWRRRHPAKGRPTCILTDDALPPLLDRLSKDTV